MRGQPKKNLRFTNLKKGGLKGKPLRKTYGETITENAPIFPKPLEYDDIDREFRKFVENDLGLVVDGKDVPTFTLYSNQRWSEYSQTWSHTDENGNLYMNFKTLNRESDPSNGENQGGYWNIPGERRYTLLQRSVLEPNGTECWEVYSMKQPYAVDLTYRVSFITDLYENINTFNETFNDIFKARQHYIRPNGHYIPMVLEQVQDESKYSVSDVRFYIQTIDIKVMAYIIHEDDFKVEKFPKRINIDMAGSRKRPKPQIDIEEYEIEENNLQNQHIDVTIKFEPWQDKVEFVIDTDMNIETIEKANVRNMRVFVNDEPVFWEKGFEVKEGDTIRIKLFTFAINDRSRLILRGINPNILYDDSVTPLKVSDEPVKNVKIDVK